MPDASRPSVPEAPSGRSFVRRHVALLVAVTALVTAGAYGYASLQEPTYTATAQVLVEPLTLPTAVQRTPDMGTEQAVATSSSVLRGAADTLGVALNTVGNAVTVTVPVNANILDISYSSTSPTTARDGATAVADAYMAYRVKTNAPTTGGSVANTLTAPGVLTRLVTPAARPASPSAPDFVVDVLAGLVVGIVVAGALAFLVDRFGTRMRGVARWQELTGLPVLVGLRRDSMIDDSAHGRVRASTVVRYLRMRVAQSLPDRGAVLLLTDVREQPERNAVARALTASFVDAGTSGVLIEMTCDHDDATSAATAAAGDLRVRVTFFPKAAPMMAPAGEWHMTTIHELLRMVDRHRSGQAVVVVTAPPVSMSLTALDVAAIADVAVVLDHVATARRREAERVIAELRAAGCTVAGGVLLGLPKSYVGDAAPAPVAAPAEPAARASSRDRTARARPRISLTYIDGPARAGQHDVANGRTS